MIVDLFAVKSVTPAFAAVAACLVEDVVDHACKGASVAGYRQLLQVPQPRLWVKTRAAGS